MPDGYSKYRTTYSDISGQLLISPLFSGTIVLQAPPGDAAHIVNYTIFLQNLYGTVTIPLAGGTWKFQDDSVAPIPIYTVPTDTVTDTGAGVIQGLASNFQCNFSAAGVGLSQGKKLVLVISSGGAAGSISWEGYARITAVAAP
jgi:hypothetical protein